MWKEKKYRVVSYMTGGDNQNIKSFFTRKRKWKRFYDNHSDILHLIASDTGIYVFIDNKGFIRRYETIRFLLSAPDTYTLQVCDGSFGSSHYIWSNHFRFASNRVSSHECKPNHKKVRNYNNCIENSDRIKKKKVWENNKKRDQIAEAKIANKNKNKRLVGKSNLKQNVEYKYDYSSSADDYSLSGSESLSESDEEIIEKPVYRYKKIPKKLRYLYSDSYVVKRRSKRKSLYFRDLSEDFVLTIKTQSNLQKHVRLSSNHGIDHEAMEETDEEHVNPFGRTTLGDFVSLRDIAQFDIIALKSGAQTLRDNRDVDPNVALPAGVYDVIEVELKDYNNVPTNVDIEHTTSSEVVKNQTQSKTDKQNEIDENQIIRSPVMLVSRFATRPDNLRKDFKLNYKEAQCKPRRFIINISQLAYQNFVLRGREALQIIPRLDLTLYLVFSFLKEGKDDADEYRVDINTTLPLNDSKTIMAPLCEGEIKSVHEIMQHTIVALDTLNLNQIKKKRQIRLKDDMSHKAMHSFNLLSMACKWNVQIIESPLSLEWSQGLPSLFGLDSDAKGSRTFKSESVINDKVTSKHNQATNSRRQGPQKPSLCGICLQDFNKDTFSFPLAPYICSHWFCENCWKAHFHFHSNKPDQNYQYKCIEAGCNSLIDPMTMLSLFNLQVVRDYELRKWKHSVDNNPDLKLCINSSCNNILQAKHFKQMNGYDQNANVTCSCLFQKCFSCSSSSHWPISCAISKIYQRRMSALNHDSNNRCLEDNELPDMALKGKSCPKCASVLQENLNFTGLKSCTCGCVMCWACGKEVHELEYNSHVACTQNFHFEDQKLKQRLNNQDKYWVKIGEITRWYKVALLHRQNQHPQVASIIYKMAGQIAETITEISRKGKYVGNVKQACVGWKTQFKKLADRRLKQLETSKLTNHNNIVQTYEFDKCISVYSPTIQNNTAIYDDGIISPRSNSSLSSVDSERLSLFECNVEHKNNDQSDPLIRKAMWNIVDTKLELHHVIEHVAVLLEYSHTLHQPGKIIRLLERAEDLCTCLDMLLQPTHREGSARIIPSYLRLRTQIVSLYSSLQGCLKENGAYQSKKAL